MCIVKKNNIIQNEKISNNNDSDNTTNFLVINRKRALNHFKKLYLYLNKYKLIYIHIIYNKIKNNLYNTYSNWKIDNPVEYPD